MSGGAGLNGQMPPPGLFDDDEPPSYETEPPVGRITSKRHDLANAEALIRLHGEELRYVGTWRQWLAWDGKRWEADEGAGALRLAIDTVRILCSEALDGCAKANEALVRAGGPREADPEFVDAKKEADKDLVWACSSQDSSRLKAMLHVATGFPEVAAPWTALDADPWALNVANGILDLRTGALRAHLRSELHTKLAPVIYDESAKCPVWLAYLDRVMGSSGHLQAYLQRIVGYAMTGVIREHALFFFYGNTGKNGKSTFLRTIQGMLGDYACTTHRKLLFRSGAIDRHPTELATLHGKRFASCPEIEEGQAFDESLVKTITGGDSINARRMRENEWTFLPTHKCFLPGNHKPLVRGTDGGIWRRIRLIPWLVEIPTAEIDSDLDSKLLAELPGILAWAVQGCLEWQRHGLADPEVVTQATAEYRASSDVVAQFFGECLRFDGESRVGRATLRTRYVEWCEELGHEPLGAKRFSEALARKGVVDGGMTRESGKIVNAWLGVRLKNAEDHAMGLWAKG